jgi:hypothetical protein
MNPRLPYRLAACLLSMLLLAAPAAAGPAADELLRLVPADAALCLVVQDLRGHADALANSPFLAQFQASPLGLLVRNAPEWKQLAEAEKTFKDDLGVDWASLRDDIFGDAVVFAFRPSPPGKQEPEEGVALIRARNAEVLADVVDRLNKVQLKRGELKKLDEVKYQGVKFFRREEQNQAPYFYWLRGSVLVVSSQETMIQRAVDLDRQAPTLDAGTPFFTTQFRRAGVDKALLALWVNPRSFDADLEKKVKAAPAAEAAFLQAFHDHWKALDGVVLSADAARGFEVCLALWVRNGGLPAPTQRLLAEAAKRSALWDAFPEDALAAFAGRLDAAALVDAVAQFMTEEARKAARSALEKGPGPALARVYLDVLPHIGPDFGWCVLAPTSAAKEWLPQGVAALRIRPGSGAKTADQTILDLLNFFAYLALVDYNNKHEDRLSLKSTTVGQAEVKYFSNDKTLPPGVQPAFAFKDGYLLVASSPDAIGRLNLKAAPTEKQTEAPIFRLSLKHLRNYLTERREAVVATLAEQHHVPADEAGRRLDGLLLGLQFFDTVELVQRPEANQAVVTLRIRPARPLRK